MSPISASRKYCEDVVKKRARNFAVALRLLPTEKRQALYAIYAFARVADDIADGDRHDLTLDDLRQQLDGVVAQRQPDGHNWQAALGDAIRRYELDTAHFHQLLEGMVSDLNHQPCQTWHETEVYCYRAASTIGLLCLEVFGYVSPKARRRARDLGMAMQLTNILRDLREDRARGRQYLPAEDFADFRVSPEQLYLRRPPEAALAFMRFQVDRAQTYFESAQKLFPLVNKDAAFCPKALGAIYGEYLDALRKNPFSSLQGDLSIAKHRKLWLTIKSRWGK